MKILVAYDGSAPSKKALDKAVEMSNKLGYEVTLLTVIESFCPIGVGLYIPEEDCRKMDEIRKKETENILNNIKNELEEKALKIRVLAIKGSPEGSPVDEIIKLAKEENFDMIMLGSHGRRGIDKFMLGSVSQKVASLAPCSVVIVK